MGFTVFIFDVLYRLIYFIYLINKLILMIFFSLFFLLHVYPSVALKIMKGQQAFGEATHALMREPPLALKA